MPQVQKISVEMWRNLETILIWAYRGRVLPCHLDIVADNKNLTAWFILQGGVEVTIENKRIEAKANQWVLLGQGTRRQIFRPNTHILSIHFRMALLTGQSVFPEHMGLVLAKKDGHHLERAARALERFVFQRLDQPGLELMEMAVTLKNYLRMQELFYRWIDAYGDALQKKGIEMSLPRESDERVYRTLQTVAAWPLHLPFSEEKIAAQLGLSPSHLDRIFLLELGSTPRKVFENRRLEHVKRKLRLPNSSIKEIAASLGFMHLGNFSKWFRRSEGVSPRDFQNGNATVLLT